MPLVTTTEMLRQAQRQSYAIGAFNVENAEMVRAVCAAAKQADAAVILQTTSSTLKYLGSEYFVGMAQAAVREFGVTAALHLDHGVSHELACGCIEAGYTSVMIDGSKLSFDENVALTKRVVDYAHTKGIPVEAELGTVGGKEDEVVSAGDQYTNPAQAECFMERTGADSLAIGFGTSHGVYATPPVLDLNRVRLVRELVEVPLVMHGTSGICEHDVQTAIRNGICKVNFATELREAFSSGVSSYLQEYPHSIDPKSYLTRAQQRVTALVLERIAQMYPPQN